MSRVVCALGALLLPASLAQAGDNAAFAETNQEALMDIRPIVKVAPEPAPTDSVPSMPASRPRTARSAQHARPSRIVAGAKPEVRATTEIASNTEAAAPTPGATPPDSGLREAPSGTIADLLAKHARANGVPLKLAQAVVQIESRGNVRASNAGALGLMQIKYGTARAAGFTGSAAGLFAADTNLRYGMKVLGDALKASRGDTCGALMRYQSGHLSTHMSRANQVYCSKARAIMAGV